MKVEPLAPVVSEEYNRSCDIEKVLMDLVPQDVLKEQVRSSLAKDAEELKNQVPFPKDEADKAKAELQNDPNVTEESKSKITEEFGVLFDMAGKTFGQIEAENPMSEEEIDEISKEVKECLVLAWIHILVHCAKEAPKNASGRLNEDLLPTMSPSTFFTDPEETFLDYIINMASQNIREEQAKAIYLSFKDKVKEAVDQRPDGLEVHNDLFLKKDENGYFVTRKV